MSYRSRRHFLQVPGPTNVPDRVLRALAAPTIDHRGPEFAALAVSREAQARTGVSINKIVKTLRPLRTATITLGRQQITAEPRIPAPARQILDDLAGRGH